MRDLRDCSGPWSGFWIQEPLRGTMKLRLSIQGESILGDGMDEIGAFVIHGNYWPALELVKFRKRYPSHDIEYNGTWDGSMISGKWRMRPNKYHYADSGGFDIWPDSEEESIESFTNVVEERITVTL